jgi:hypothetical protein
MEEELLIGALSQLTRFLRSAHVTSLQNTEEMKETSQYMARPTIIFVYDKVEFVKFAKAKRCGSS